MGNLDHWDRRGLLDHQDNQGHLGKLVLGETLVHKEQQVRLVR
jgi:hypothetical protein